MDNNKVTETYYGFIFVMKSNGTICGRFPMTRKECIFGRSDDCDIRILLDSVSAHHCIIFYLDDKAYIRDKSLVGSTKVNGKGIGRNNFLLHQSDVIEIVGKKFIWEYTKTYADSNILSDTRLGQRSNCLTPKVSQCSSTQITSLNNYEMSHTPAKSKSTTLLSINNTPIIVTKNNMSKSSFDKLKNSLKKPNSDANCKPEHPSALSNSVTGDHNIPVISDSNTTPRKSWVIPSAADKVSPSRIYNLNNVSWLSSNSLNIHPNHSTSYHYSDNDVEFDIECNLSNDERSVTSTDTLCTNNLSVENPSLLIDNQDDNDSQFKSIQINNLSDSEPEPSTSRRDTYSIDNEQIEVGKRTTPVPRRSILKCSKSAKPFRSRLSCRKVQFVHLPKSDSRIKISKNRFNSRSNISNDDKINETDVFQDSKKVMQIDGEEYDDDLDGVQPLDSSVSSLINSPILDNSSINKSSKRGSRGNKVMSLVNCFEKRTDSSKHSIRASDLLSMTGSKHGHSLSTADFENDASVSRESISSSRRINLENVFVTEDSLKNTCDLETEIVSETDRSLIHGDETTVNSKQDLSNTNTTKVSNDLAEDDFENEMVSETDKSLIHGAETTLSSKHDLNNTDTAKVSNDLAEDDFENEMVSETDKSLIHGAETTLNSKHDLNNTDTAKVSNDLAEDDFENEMVSETDKSLIHGVETTLNSKHDLNNTDTAKVSNDLAEDDFENEMVSEIDKSLIHDVESSLNSKHDLNNIDSSVVSNDLTEDDLENKIISETVKSLIHGVETTLNSKQDLITDVAKVSNDIAEDDLECECSFVPSLYLQSQNDSNTVAVITNFSDSTIADIEKNQVDKIENYSLVHEVKNISNQNNINYTCNDHSKHFEKTIDEEICVDIVETTNRVEQPGTRENEHIQIPNNVSNLIEQISDKKSPSISKIAHCMSEMFNISKDDLETTNSQQQEEITESYVLVENDNENKLNFIKDNENNSDQLDKSTKDASTIYNELKNSETHPPKKMVKVLNISSDSSDEMEVDENTDKVHKSLERTISTSIGKPQHESTPWSSSTGSKTTFNTTLSIRPIETNCNGVFKNESEEKKNSSKFVSELEYWSQMMKDFNESVRKASVSNNNIVNVNTVAKVLFSSEPESCEIVSHVVPKENQTSNDIIIKENTSYIEKKNTSQCSTVSWCSNNALKPETTNGPRRQSSRTSSKNNILKRKSPRGKNVNFSNVEEIDNTSKSSIHDVISPSKNNSVVTNTVINKNNKSETKTILLNNGNSNVTKKKLLVIPQEITIDTESNEVTSANDDHDFNVSSDSMSNKSKTVIKKNSTNPSICTKRNLRARVKKNESCKLVKNHTKKRTTISDETTTDDDTESSLKSTMLPASRRELHSKERVSKHTVTGIKKQTPIKSKKNENNFAKIKQVIGKSEKITLPPKARITRSNVTVTETSTPKLDKINKTVSLIKTKSAKVGKAVHTKKSTKKVSPKCVLHSKSIKTNSSDFSGYDDSASELEESTKKRICVPPKTKKNMKKEKDIEVDNNSASLTKKRVKKENIAETSSNVSSYQKKRRCKRTADTLNTNDPIINISSKIVTNSSQENLSPEVKRSRNIKDIKVDNNLTSLTKKHVKKEKLAETSSNVSSYLNTRRRKQIADTSNANDAKINISSKTVANTSQENSMPKIKRTRNMSKLTANVLDSKLTEIESVNKVEKPKSIQKTNARKRVHKFEALSNDSEQPAIKKTRRASEENKETEVKINSFTRNASKNKNISTDTKERLKTNEVKKSKSLHLPKRITRNARQAILETTERFPSPRVLRVRNKKK